MNVKMINEEISRLKDRLAFCDQNTSNIVLESCDQLFRERQKLSEAISITKRQTPFQEGEKSLEEIEEALSLLEDKTSVLERALEATMPARERGSLLERISRNRQSQLDLSSSLEVSYWETELLQ